MVEDFMLTGRNKPKFSRLVQDIKSGKIPGVVYVPLGEKEGKISKCLGLLEGKERKVKEGNFLHVFREGLPGVFPGDPEKISCFARFGSNYNAEKVVRKIADYYKLGYRSNTDGTKKKAPK